MEHALPKAVNISQRPIQFPCRSDKSQKNISDKTSVIVVLGIISLCVVTEWIYMKTEQNSI